MQPGPYGYWVLGQAYASLRFKDHTFTGYRQLIDELEVNPNDDRMTPQTFEAYALSGAFGPVSYFAAYVSKMKGRNDSDFHNMATEAGAPANVTAGMWARKPEVHAVTRPRAARLGLPCSRHPDLELRRRRVVGPDVVRRHA